MDSQQAQETTDRAARFPDGVAAVSDASQTEWMEYVYMQQPKPINATGVPVTLSVMDANGNYRSIGASHKRRTDSIASNGNQTSQANTQSTPHSTVATHTGHLKQPLLRS